MKRNVYIAIIFVVIIAIIYFVYSFNNFQIFDVEVKKISNIKLTNKPYKLGIYYVPSNASNQSSIQIREEKKDSVIQFYERYNYFKEYRIINDTLILFIADTSLVPIKIDTLHFKLP
jgi:hypothetical protein